MSDSSPIVSALERLLLDAEEVAPLLGLGLRETYRVASIPAGQPGAFPPGVVIRLGRRVRFSRPRLLEWLGAINGDGQTHDPATSGNVAGPDRDERRFHASG